MIFLTVINQFHFTALKLIHNFVRAFAGALISMPRLLKQLIGGTLDVFNALISLFIASLVTGYDTSAVEYFYNPDNRLFLFLFSVAFLLPLFWFFGLYSEVVRYLNSFSSVQAFKGCLLHGLVALILIFCLQPQGISFRSSVVASMLIFTLTVFFRQVAKFLLRFARTGVITNHQIPKVLIYGVCPITREFLSTDNAKDNFNILGLLSSSQSLIGRRLGGIKIYDVKNFELITQSLGVDEILISTSSMTSDERVRVISRVAVLHLKARVLTNPLGNSERRKLNEDLREISVSEILGREAVPPQKELLSQDISGKVVLVTGAGGSIGGELCKQIINHSPRALVVLDHNEYSLYKIMGELLSKADKNVPIVSSLGTLTNENFLINIFKVYEIQTIYHAAAYKHVTLVEENVCGGIFNNVFGTALLCSQALSSSVEKMVLISSDKAVRPTNVMGATKRVSELIFQASGRSQTKTQFSIVRFGNVLNSSGSVVPLFKEQISKGGPITVTDELVTRFFMTLTEAAQLVIQAGAISSTETYCGIHSPIFILDMGAPVSILSLAKKLVELEGLYPYTDADVSGDIKIEFTGLRPGEKLYEELSISGDLRPTMHPKINHAEEEFLESSQLQAALDELKRHVDKNEVEPSINCLFNLIGVMRGRTLKSPVS